MVSMKTMTVTKIWTSVWLWISKFYDFTKFHYHQVAGEKVIHDQNFWIFCFWPPWYEPKSPCIMCVQYMGGCSVHGGMFSTWRDVQYMEGCSVRRGVTWVQRGYHEFFGGCSVHRGMPWVHRGDIISTSWDVQYIGGYHEYIGGCSVHREDIMMHVGDTISTLGDVQYIGGYHEYIGGYHEYIGGFQYKLKGFHHLAPPHASWYLPDVLMICTEHPPMYWIHIIQGVNTRLTSHGKIDSLETRDGTWPVEIITTPNCPPYVTTCKWLWIL